MTAEDGDFAARWKPGPRAKALWRGALDLIFPPQALDGGPRPLAGGFSASAWSRAARVDLAVVARVKEAAGLTI